MNTSRVTSNSKIDLRCTSGIVQILGLESGASESEWEFKEVVLLVEVVVEVVVVEVDVKLVADLVAQISPDEPSNISSLLAFEVSHASPQSVCAKDDALENILSMLITRDTSHLEMSPLKDDAE